MKVCVFGAGATGGHFAALLSRAGAEVSVVVRGANLQAIRQSGLRLDTDDGPIVARVKASVAARELGPQDVVLVSLKSHALPHAAAGIAALLGPETPVVFLQNGIPWWYYHGHGGEQEGQRLPGIDPGDALWNAIGPERAIGGITSSACTVVAPGVVAVRGGNRALTLGEPDGSDSARLCKVASMFREAGFPAETTPAIRDAIWTKLVLNLGSGPLGVLVPMPVQDLCADGALLHARLRIQAEVMATASAMGCRVDPAFIASQLEFARRSPHVPSIAQDAAAGRKLELETMFLAPLQMAREKAVPTPTLDLLVGLCLLKAKAAGLYP